MVRDMGQYLKQFKPVSINLCFEELSYSFIGWKESDFRDAAPNSI